jgi:hypothetical protein
MHRFSKRPALAGAIATGAFASLFAASSTAATIERISVETCAHMAAANTISPTNPVGCDRLRTVRFDFATVDGSPRQGSVVVLDAVAPAVANIFDKLYARAFPLEQARPLEHFNGEDHASMDANNTSAFNGRVIAGTTSISMHAYGVAIDLSPAWNPNIDINSDGTAVISPTRAARSHVNRQEPRAGRPDRPGLAESVRDVFEDHGFLQWGGDWNFPVDYQHFQIGTRALTEALVALPPAQGEEAFSRYVSDFHRCLATKNLQGDPVARRRACVAEAIARTSLVVPSRP